MKNISFSRPLAAVLIGGSLIALTSVLSCRKDVSNSGSQSTANLHVLARAAPYRDMPTVVNSILTFRDQAQFDSYSSYLDSAVVIPEGDTDSVGNDPNDILESIESGLGFTSLRHTTEATFATLNENGWDRLEDVPEKHFINDLGTKSVLNANADVSIAGQVTHFINKDFAVSLPVAENALLDQVHSLNTSATVSDIVALDPMQQKVSVLVLSGNEIKIGSTHKGTTNGFNVAHPTVTTPDPCNTPTRIKFDGVTITALTSNVGVQIIKGEFLILWGDGTSNSYTSTLINGNYGLANVYHQYPTNGTYHVTIKGRQYIYNNNSPLYDDELHFDVTVPNYCNYTGNKTQGSVWHYTNNSMNRAWWGKAWIEEWNLGQNPKHKIGGLTESYLYTSNKWKMKNTDRVVVQFSTTKYAIDCSNSWGDSGADWPRNAKQAYAQHQNNGAIGWRTIWFNHRIEKDGQTFSFDQELKACQ